MPRFAIELHAWDFQVEDDEIETAFAGVRAVRVVNAQSIELAEELAVRGFREELRQRSEILTDVGSSSIEVEEVSELGDDDFDGTSLVFYVDTDDPRNQPSGA